VTIRYSEMQAAAMIAQLFSRDKTYLKVRREAKN
jgi:hypothetical protein